MKNQKGISLITLSIIIVLLLSLSVAAVEVVDDSNAVISKAEEAKVQTSHGEINEQLELNHQAYYIEKLTGEYNGDLIAYFKDKGFINEEGIVNMSSLLGKREKKIFTGKGNDGIDIYKVEMNPDTKNDVKIMYYDKNGSAVQIGEIPDTV